MSTNNGNSALPRNLKVFSCLCAVPARRFCFDNAVVGYLRETGLAWLGWSWTVGLEREKGQKIKIHNRNSYSEISQDINCYVLKW